jgi:hypothetical protein
MQNAETVLGVLRELRGGHVILSGVYDAPGSDVTHVTCFYLLVAALLSSEPCPESHVSDMSQTQNPHDQGLSQMGLR